MSIPLNPLDATNSSSYRHLLVAFKYGEDAFDASSFNPRNAIPGKPIEGLGENVVVVNEFVNQKFTIPQAVWDFNFIPEIGVSTSSSVGRIVIADRYIPYYFLDFLREKVLDTFGESENSISQVTFMLKTFFTLTDELGGDETINVNPFYFTVDSIESVPVNNSPTPTQHVMNVMGVQNTTGLLRSFSSVFQLSITHKEGNVHDEVPVSGTGNGLQTRANENTFNNSKRKERLDKSKPMVTLKDMFEGLQADLNQQKFVHQAQLQRWLRELRSDGLSDKIIIPPEQTKGPDPKKLPINFTIDLDDVYKEYSVDNRNMPFEQPDVRQDEPGIRVFPIRTGLDIFTLIERIMMLSKQLGRDAIDTPRKTFKTTITASRTSTDEYEINIKIRKYELPKNTHNENTGPGTAAEPLHFFINDSKDRDTDIFAFKSALNYPVGDKMLEEQIEDTTGAGVVYADREQATAERRPDLPFFKTMYSGIRPMIGSYVIDGLESAQRAGDILNLMDRYTYTQTSDFDLVIMGNPYLLSDVNRNPKDVVADVDGPVVHYYPKPESHPMYARLTIFENSYNDETGDSEVPLRHYFDNFYHICRVVNAFGMHTDRDFRQHLLLKRTDDLV